MKFLMFMERSKGYEEDTKKFMILSLQSSSLQIDYEMIQPYVNRVIKKKGGQEIPTCYRSAAWHTAYILGDSTPRRTSHAPRLRECEKQANGRNRIAWNPL